MSELIRLDWAKSHDQLYDWDIGNLWIAIPKPKGKSIPKFNQKSDSTITYNSCTIVWATREYCYMNWIEFSKKLMEDVVRYASKNMWYVIGSGWNSWMGMMAVKNYFGEWNFARVSYDDPNLYLYYKNQCTLWITYRGNRAWNIDSDDGELSGDRYDNTTYWHRTTTIFKDKFYIDDSFNGSLANIYSIPYLIRLVNNINIYPTFYLWIPPVNKEDEVKELQRIISGYDIIINWMMEQYRTYRNIDIENNNNFYLKTRQELLSEVWFKRREREYYIELLRKTQI